MPGKQINLLRGWPSPALLPASLISSAFQKILADKTEYTAILEYGPDEGHPKLRQALADWLGAHYSVQPDPERICISGGASQNLACVLQSFTDVNYTKAVWMIAPCYHLAAAMFEDSGFGGRLHAVPEDEEGVDIEYLEAELIALEEQESKSEQAKPFKLLDPARKLYRYIIYGVPTCSNPSGKTMSLRNRESLVKLARKYDTLIVTDDVYDFLQWPLEGPVTPDWPREMRLPRLCDIDLAMGPAENDPKGFGHAISNGSFSKIAGPGVRTGWVEASPAFVVGLSRTASSRSGGAPSQLCAAMLSELLENGQLVDYLEQTVRPSLQRRHKLMLEAIKEHLGRFDVKYRTSSLENGATYGGYFVWLELGREFPADLVADQAAKEEDLIVGYGNMFAVHGDEKSAVFDDSIRLCFAWEAEEDLVEGVKRISRVLSRMQENPRTKAQDPSVSTLKVISEQV